MPLQLLEIGSHVEIHAIEWHDFERDTQFHGVVVAWIEFSQNIYGLAQFLSVNPLSFLEIEPAVQVCCFCALDPRFIL